MGCLGLRRDRGRGDRRGLRARCGRTRRRRHASWRRGWSSRRPSSATRSGRRDRAANRVRWELHLAHLRAPCSRGRGPVSPVASAHLGFGTVSAELDPGMTAQGCSTSSSASGQEDLHDGAQCLRLLGGDVLLDVAVGESRPGRPLRTDDVMLWYSSGKPLTTVAVLQLWEQGRLGLDDRIGDYVDGWGNGKERCTIRHVLIHTGGFPMYGSSRLRRPTSRTPRRCWPGSPRTPATWEPGTAGRLPPGHRLEGARRGRGSRRRPAHRDATCATRSSAPLGADGRRRWASRSNGRRELGDRLVPVAWTGHRFPVVEDDGAPAAWCPTGSTSCTTSPGTSPRSEPGAAMRGPARELGRFYESLLGFGPPAARAAHRRDDGRGAPPRACATWCSASRRRGGSAWPSTSAAAPDGARSATAAWRRHAGSPTPTAGSWWCSSRNGLARSDRRRAAPGRRHRRGVHRARATSPPASAAHRPLSATVASRRSPARSPRGCRACTSGGPATMSPDVSHARSSPCQSVTTPPASRTSSAPAATSQVPRPARSSRRTRPAASTRGRGWRRRPGAGPRTCSSARSNTGRYSARRSRLARNGNPVAQIACSGSRVLTRIGSPLRNAPPPEARRVDVAEHRRVRRRPTTARRRRPVPTDTPTTGKPCTKLAVPSSGSTNQPTSARSPPASSPKNASSGAASCSELAAPRARSRVGVAHPVARALLAHVAARAPNASSTIAAPAAAARRAAREQARRGRGRARHRRGPVRGARRAARWCPPPTSCRRASASATTRSRPSASTTSAPASWHTSRPPR